MASPTRPGKKECSSTRTPEQVRWDWVRLWLAKAEEDVLAGDLILKGSMPSYETVGFHAQQAAKKALKALLIRHQVEFGKTHNLGELLGLAEPAAPGITGKLSDAEVLTPFAVDTRYPTEEPAVDREQAARYLALAREVFDHIRALVKPYLDAGRPSG
ncbi:MAG: HEPN domain-containing protein [Candidatus Methylomirabilia bacterium]